MEHIKSDNLLWAEMPIINKENGIERMCQKINDCDLQFIDAIIDGENLFFSSWYSNGLFRLKKDEEEVEYIGDFQETFPLFLHRQVFDIAGKYYFIPYKGSGISIYDKETGNISHIEMAGMGNLHISRAYMIQTDIYMVPRDFHTPFMIFHTENNEYEVVEEFWHNISMFFLHPEKIFFDLYSSCIVESRLFICGVEADGMVLSVDLKNWTGGYYKLSKPYQIRNIYFDKERFYFVLRDQCCVVCWDYKTNQCCEYLIDIKGQKIERPFMRIIRWGNHLLLLPDQTDSIWEFDEIGDEWYEKKEYIPKDFYRKKRGGSLFVGYKIWDDKLFLFPRAGNGMVVLSEYESVLYDISCPAELNKMIQRKWGRYVNEQTVRGEVIYENDLTLEDIMFLLPYISYGVKVPKNGKIGKTTWELCSH